jgi:hypothetical protein
MKIDFFMVVREATVDAGGALDLKGGGISHVAAHRLPAQIALEAVARFISEETDMNSSFDLGIRWLDPEGKALKQSLPYTLEPPTVEGLRQRRHEGEEPAFVIVWGMADVIFDDVGVYKIQLLVDGEPRAERTIAVSVSEGPPVRRASGRSN